MNYPHISIKGRRVKICVEMELQDSMIDCEKEIRKRLNEGGVIATAAALKHFDTDGTPIKVKGETYTAQGFNPETYHSPYGDVHIKRYIYQSCHGGKTYCPVEDHARIVVKSTPDFARLITFKYGNSGAENVCRDIKESFHLNINKSLVQRLGEAVGAFLGAKEESWEYSLPKTKKPTSCVSIGMDGTMMLLCEDGYREAMVGTIALYDKEGERQHTIYTAATPQYGKEQFLERFRKEIQRVKRKLPNVNYIGLADGARCNWPFLEEFTDSQLVDFYHSSKYITEASDAMFRKKSEKKEWQDRSCHRLKHNKTGSKQILKEMKNALNTKNLSSGKVEKLQKSITYFKNNSPKMKYSTHHKSNQPIGSGVTESAAKVLVKQRLCNSGMRWKEKGAASVLHIRTIIMTEGRWDEAWEKVRRYGFTRVAA
jgi:quinol monooxygenase YgiN